VKIIKGIKNRFFEKLTRVKLMVRKGIRNVASKLAFVYKIIEIV